MWRHKWPNYWPLCDLFRCIFVSFEATILKMVSNERSRCCTYAQYFWIIFTCYFKQIWRHLEHMVYLKLHILPGGGVCKSIDRNGFYIYHCHCCNANCSLKWIAEITDIRILAHQCYHICVLYVSFSLLCLTIHLSMLYFHSFRYVIY